MSVPKRMPVGRRAAACVLSLFLALGGVPVAPAAAEDAEGAAAEASAQAENLAEESEESKQAEGLGETEGEAGESSSSEENAALITQGDPMSEEQDETFEVDYYINTQWDGSEVTYPVGTRRPAPWSRTLWSSGA